MTLLFVDSLLKCKSRMLKTAAKALELMLLSAGLIWTLLMVKEAVMPYSCELVEFWNFTRCLLSSHLHICIMINIMVILILASSKFHCKETEYHDFDNVMVIGADHDVQISDVSPAPPPQISKTAALPPAPDAIASQQPSPSFHSTTQQCSFSSFVIASSNLDDSPNAWKYSMDGNSKNISDLSSPDMSFSKESLSSVANGTERKGCPLNSSPESSAPMQVKMVTPSFQVFKGMSIEKEDTVADQPSKVKENEENDSMESTWKAIAGGGKQRPRKKVLKKSETWQVPVPPQRLDSEEVLPSTTRWKELRKSETFNDAVSITRRGGLRRDPSISLDELNKRFENFIKDFNDEMRLQRQESDQRFLDMINRGV